MNHLRARLEEEKKVGRGVIVSYGLGEVNTGAIGGDLVQVADLCEELGAWLHVDAGGSTHFLVSIADTHSIRWFCRFSPWSQSPHQRFR